MDPTGDGLQQLVLIHGTVVGGVSEQTRVVVAMTVQELDDEDIECVPDFETFDATVRFTPDKYVILSENISLLVVAQVVQILMRYSHFSILLIVTRLHGTPDSS